MGCFLAELSKSVFYRSLLASKVPDGPMRNAVRLGQGLRWKRPYSHRSARVKVGHLLLASEGCRNWSLCGFGFAVWRTAARETLQLTLGQ